MRILQYNAFLHKLEPVRTKRCHRCFQTFTQKSRNQLYCCEKCRILKHERLWEQRVMEHLDHLYTLYLDAILYHNRSSIHDARQTLMNYIYEYANGDAVIRKQLFDCIEQRLKEHFSQEEFSLDTKAESVYTSVKRKD